MLIIHIEMFSNVSCLGLGLIHCGLGLKIFGPRPRRRPLFLASASASCPAGLVNIPATQHTGSLQGKKREMQDWAAAVAEPYKWRKGRTQPMSGKYTIFLVCDFSVLQC